MSESEEYYEPSVHESEESEQSSPSVHESDLDLDNIWPVPILDRPNREVQKLFENPFQQFPVYRPDEFDDEIEIKVDDDTQRFKSFNADWLAQMYHNLPDPQKIEILYNALLKIHRNLRYFPELDLDFIDEKNEERADLLRTFIRKRANRIVDNREVSDVRQRFLYKYPQPSPSYYLLGGFENVETLNQNLRLQLSYVMTTLQLVMDGGTVDVGVIDNYRASLAEEISQYILKSKKFNLGTREIRESNLPPITFRKSRKRKYQVFDDYATWMKRDLADDDDD